MARSSSRARAVDVLEPRAGYEIVPAGHYATLSVSDDGCGIEPHELGQVFEPFFTKKRAMETSGSGLGLAIVHGVVKEHDGFIDVSSTPEWGPPSRSTSRSSTARSAGNRCRGRQRGSARILHRRRRTDPAAHRTAGARSPGIRRRGHGQRPARLRDVQPRGWLRSEPVRPGHHGHAAGRGRSTVCRSSSRSSVSSRRRRSSSSAATRRPERAELAVRQGLTWLGKPYGMESACPDGAAGPAQRRRPKVDAPALRRRRRPGAGYSGTDGARGAIPRRQQDRPRRDGGDLSGRCRRASEGFQKPVVLKRILPALAADPHFVRMLVDEAHIASTLNHSNLVQVLDLGKSGDQYFLVLEFVDGWSLEQVRRRAPAGQAEAADPARAVHRRRALPGPGLRPHARAQRQAARHRAPGRDAPERAHQPARRGEAGRLRHRQGGRQEREVGDRHHQGEVRVHVARAVAGRGRSTRAPICSRSARCSTS